jgi:hypothetical protein
MDDWKLHAEQFAARITHSTSRWLQPIATSPRHLLVPRWWYQPRGGEPWELGDGLADLPC